MFDIGFFELLVIGVVALLVIGPERLPETIRGILLTVGRIKRGLSNTRQELERQIGADDIRRQLHNEDIMARLEQTKQGIDDTLNAPKAFVDDIKNGLEGNSQSDAPAPGDSSSPDDSASSDDHSSSAIKPAKTNTVAAASDGEKP